MVLMVTPVVEVEGDPPSDEEEVVDEDGRATTKQQLNVTNATN